MAAGQDKSDRRQVWGLMFQGLPEGGLAALESGLKESLAFRNQGGETSGSGRTQRLAFLFEQGLTVGGVFDLLVTIIGAAMGSDFGRAIEQADGRGRSNQGQRAAQGRRRHGIIVEVEANPESFVGVDR